MKRGGRIEIHGDAGQVAAGSITNHNHYWTLGYPTEGVPEVPWWERPNEELAASLRIEQAVFWKAWRRYWFNLPSVLMAAILLGIVARVGASILSLAGPAGVLEAVEWWFALGAFLLITPLGIWMSRIRRIEGIVAEQAQANIDALRTVQARRKALNR